MKEILVRHLKGVILGAPSVQDCHLAGGLPTPLLFDFLQGGGPNSASPLSSDSSIPGPQSPRHLFSHQAPSCSRRSPALPTGVPEPSCLLQRSHCPLESKSDPWDPPVTPFPLCPQLPLPSTHGLNLTDSTAHVMCFNPALWSPHRMHLVTPVPA